MYFSAKKEDIMIISAIYKAIFLLIILQKEEFDRITCTELSRGLSGASGSLLTVLVLVYRRYFFLFKLQHNQTRINNS